MSNSNFPKEIDDQRAREEEDFRRISATWDEETWRIVKYAAIEQEMIDNVKIPPAPSAPIPRERMRQGHRCLEIRGTDGIWRRYDDPHAYTA